ncbi:hypothetical protein [Aquimarina sediminis]|uniref:hypothetical protein n=1 Tax=Aquimarina sediminis TaxID=2070536 RepID=UPI000CA03653|nr:hypothetical protein [Aquimarina sediminis]
MKQVIVSTMLILLIGVLACEQENNLEERTVVENTDKIEAKGSTRGLCSYQFITAKQICDRGLCKCDPRGTLDGICAQINCFPDIFNPISPEPIYLNLCKVIRCDWVYNDPWSIYYKADPNEFGSIKDKFKLTIKSDLEGMPFAMNSNVLGIQFYNENYLMTMNYGDSMPQSSIFHLKNRLTLDESYLKELGLKGNVVEAGKYPIVFNKKNKTYNVILKVQ